MQSCRTYTIHPQEIFDMKTRTSLIVSLSSACLILVGSQLSGAQSPSAGTDSAAVDSHVTAELVPAEVELNKTLDARKDQPGSLFEARLDGTVHLKDGTELPNGTILVGKVATDQMNSNGTSRLALQFTEAKLKDGKTIPIEATIVGISGPSESYDGSSNYTGPLPWNGTSLKYDDIDVLSHVDLHSTIGGMNSGTLVATDKSDMKLRTGSRMSLALGEENSN
jgi:hypothetical protein